MEIFHIIKHLNSPQEATLVGGKKVYRQESIFIKEWQGGTLVKTAPYDNHFIFTTKKIRMPFLQCTCGSMAVITGFSGYEKDASKQGQMIVCLSHATFGRHSDGTT